MMTAVIGFRSEYPIAYLKPILMMTIILIIAGLICFALFYKTIDFFENI